MLTPYYQEKDITIYHSSALDILRDMDPESVQMVVTSPPYWGLRDYGIEGQIGLEKTPEGYVQKLTDIFREVRRVLKKDGVCFLNLGDSYIGGGRGVSFKDGHAYGGLKAQNRCNQQVKWGIPTGKIDGLKPKDLCMIPARVALSLQADGWWLRQDIIWLKSNPMPESVTDRCTKSHEYIFLLTKSAHYFWDQDAVKEDGKYSTEERLARIKDNHKSISLTRNLRSVWNIPIVNHYVEIDGRFYKVSPDCPVHAPYPCYEISQRLFYDEQQDQKKNDISDMPTNLDQESASELASIPSPDYEKNQTKPLNYHGQIVDNISKNKNNESFLNNDEPQNHHRIDGIEQKPVYNSDSDSLDDSGIAILHNKGSHKNISEKVLGDNASDKIPYHKFDKKPFFQVSDLDLPYLNFNHAKCTCQEVIVEHLDTNKKSVWRINTQSNREAHFATFPKKLAETCTKAGSRIGDTVLDPFAGILTALRVARRLNRKGIGIELKSDYIDMGIKYFNQEVLPFEEPNDR